MASPFAVAVLALAALAGCPMTTGPEHDAGGDARRDGDASGGPMDVACMPGEMVCGGACVDVRSSTANCGACGMLCPAGIGCVDGACSCHSPRIVCDNTCVDGQGDPANCGACGHACGSTEQCVAGQCVAMCAAPNMLCVNHPAPDAGVVDGGADAGDDGGAVDSGMTSGDAGAVFVCADPQTDRVNCGGCNIHCNPGFDCTGGHCTCAMGRDICFGVCADLQTDPSNCGSCANDCGPGGTCAAGHCMCGPGAMLCGIECLDVQSDPANCGSCARRCMPGQDCAMGRCACTAPHIDCGAGCTDLQTDTANCGTCGTNCGPGGACTAGHCTCAVGLTMCGAACANTQNDIANCGMCGHACTGATPYCMTGTCTASPPTRYMVTTPTATAVPFVDACAVPGHMSVLAGSDDGTSAATLPFPFRYWATNLPMGQAITVSSNGWITMNTGSADASLSGSIPPGGDPALVAPHWSDNYQRTGLCIATVGTAPTRQFVVEWNDSAYCCSPAPGVDLTYEVIFSENTGVIDFAYGTITGARAAGMGLTNVTAAGGNISGCPASAGSCIPTTGQRVRFLPIP